MAAKKLRTRTLVRKIERNEEKQWSLRVRLAELEAGGRPEFPLEVASASVVETHAKSLPCLRCGEGVRVEDHAAKEFSGARRREVTVRCPRCGEQRTLYFAIASAAAN